MTGYVAPRSVEEVVDILTANPSAVVCGGGTMVMPRLSSQELNADLVVDLANVLELRRIGRDEDGTLRVGAAVNYRQLIVDPNVTDVLRGMARGITGGPQIQGQGTVGGSASYGNPASDLPGVLVALGASMVTEGPTGRRVVTASDWFLDAFVTPVTGQPVLLREILIPPREGDRFGYRKLKVAESSWPIVTASARIHYSEATDKSAGSVTIAAAAPTPFTIQLGSADPTRADLQSAIETVAPSWIDDEIASGSYRAKVAAEIARRAISAARTEAENP